LKSPQRQPSGNPETAVENTANWPMSLTWERGAAPELKKGASEGKVAAFLKSWAALFAGGKALPAGCWSKWSWETFPPGAVDDTLARLIAPEASVPKGTKRRSAIKPVASSEKVRWDGIAQELANIASSRSLTPYEALLGCEALVRGLRRPNQAALGPLWKGLADLVPTYVVDTDPVDTSRRDAAAVLRGELPWLLGMLFRGLAGSAALRQAGAAFLKQEVIGQTDSDGTPHAELVARLPLWLAPFIRIALFAEALDVAGLADEARDHLLLVIEMALPMCRADGSFGLALRPVPMLAASESLFSKGRQGTITNFLKQLSKPVAKRRPPAIETSVSNQSDWAMYAHLRSEWSPHADSITVAYHVPEPQIEVLAGGHPIVHGAWKLELEIGQTRLELADEWSCVCWHSDPDVDYMELQIAGPGKLRVERMVLLSRKDHFAILADSIHGVKPSLFGVNASLATTAPFLIRCRSTISLPSDVTAALAVDSGKVEIKGAGASANLYPLIASPGTSKAGPHEVTVTSNSISVLSKGNGQGLFSPLFIDWNPARLKKSADWVGLTVTEEAKVVGRDIAAGYRLKVAKEQWLIYRSLLATTNARALLGHHTRKETVLGTFDSSGDVEPLLLIE
jgi:hypothetical protein